MNFNGTLTRLAACCALALAANAADAATYQFSITGDYTASFQLSSTVSADDYGIGSGFVMYDVTGNYPGAALPLADVNFFNASIGGGIELDDYYGGVTLLSTDGPQLYTGTEDTPTFKLGTFALTEYQGTGKYTLTVTDVAAVPEPATYALLLGGLGIVGGIAARRRQR